MYFYLTLHHVNSSVKPLAFANAFFFYFCTFISFAEKKKNVFDAAFFLHHPCWDHAVGSSSVWTPHPHHQPKPLQCVSIWPLYKLPGATSAPRRRRSTSPSIGSRPSMLMTSGACRDLGCSCCSSTTSHKSTARPSRRTGCWSISTSSTTSWRRSPPLHWNHSST